MRGVGFRSVKQSVWRKHTTGPKTASAKKAVPVIQPLRELLAELREAEGNPANGPILRGVKLSKDGKPKPLNLNALARVIRAALLNRENYRNGQAKDWKPLEWHGYYSLRRGIATQLNFCSKEAGYRIRRCVCIRNSGHLPALVHKESGGIRTAQSAQILFPSLLP
jgi:hypothetical protein